MPSKEYLEMLKKEAGDPLPPIESTSRDKAKDFWFYHRIFFLCGGIAAILIGFFIYDMATRELPDLEIALITDQQYVPTETLEALKLDFAAFAEDYNEDGVVSVNINLYNPAYGEEAETVDPNIQMAAVTKMMADMSSMTSIIYLTDNFDESQELYDVFSVQGDVTTSATSAEEAGPLLNETELVPLTTEFTELGAAESYEDFYENLIITTRVLLVENLNNSQLTDYTNSMDTYQAILNG